MPTWGRLGPDAAPAQGLCRLAAARGDEGAHARSRRARDEQEGADELPPLLAKLPSLTALELSGAQTRASALVAAARACGAQLERLELRDVEMYEPGSQVAVAVARTKR